MKSRTWGDDVLDGCRRWAAIGEGDGGKVGSCIARIFLHCTLPASGCDVPAAHHTQWQGICLVNIHGDMDGRGPRRPGTGMWAGMTPTKGGTAQPHIRRKARQPPTCQACRMAALARGPLGEPHFPWAAALGLALSLEPRADLRVPLDIPHCRVRSLPWRNLVVTSS